MLSLGPGLGRGLRCRPALHSEVGAPRVWTPTGQPGSLGAQLGALSVRKVKPELALRKATDGAADGDLWSQNPRQDTRAVGTGDFRPCEEALQGPGTTCAPSWHEMRAFKGRGAARHIRGHISSHCGLCTMGLGAVQARGKMYSGRGLRNLGARRTTDNY